MPKTVTVSSLTFDLDGAYLAGGSPIVARLSATVHRAGRSIDVAIPLSSAEMRSVYEQLQQIALAALEDEPKDAPHA